MQTKRKEALTFFFVCFAACVPRAITRRSRTAAGAKSSRRSRPLGHDKKAVTGAAGKHDENSSSCVKYIPQVTMTCRRRESVATKRDGGRVHAGRILPQPKPTNPSTIDGNGCVVKRTARRPLNANMPSAHPSHSRLLVAHPGGTFSALDVARSRRVAPLSFLGGASGACPGSED